jgi:hypothetical protein
MSGPAEISLHEPKSDTCDISPARNDCRKVEPGGVLLNVNAPAAAQTDPHVSKRQLYGRRHRTSVRRVCPRNSATIPFYGGLERKPAFPSRWRVPGSIDGGLRGVWGAGDLATPFVSLTPGLDPRRERNLGRIARPMRRSGGLPPSGLRTGSHDESRHGSACRSPFGAAHFGVVAAFTEMAVPRDFGHPEVTPGLKPTFRE